MVQEKSDHLQARASATKVPPGRAALGDKSLRVSPIDYQNAPAMEQTFVGFEVCLGLYPPQDVIEASRVEFAEQQYYFPEKLVQIDMVW